MKTAMVWGADGGIGQALVNNLIAAEWEVFAIGRHADRLSPAVTHCLEADVNSEFAVQNVALAVGYETTAVDLWVYAVGDITAVPVRDMGYGTWQRIMQANLGGAYLAAHHSLPLLAPDAHLFFLGAVSERLRLPGLSAYAAAKAGLEAFAETLRKEERRRKVTVVRPGAVATPLWEKVALKMPKDATDPEKVAGRIMQAYHEGHTGHLDLAH
ncbi:MAG: SDR family NAD(P)-dependent oxidoreductase [Anaerolinea sp.]|nr:SDR family NAD(P)-dependent oxidoreductase [Anaerolinea sp.]